jgi:hypothetical protein
MLRWGGGAEVARRGRPTGGEKRGPGGRVGGWAGKDRGGKESE